MREARLIAEDAESDRARTKLRRESEWMAKQPRARQAKSKARQYQFYELVEAAKGRGPDKKKIELQSTEEKEKQKRLGEYTTRYLPYFTHAHSLTDTLLILRMIRIHPLVLNIHYA